MESDIGKLFVGGISWDTDEEGLKEYFSRYGEVVEAVIMRDRATGRARGFGFVVFADPAVAERVIMDKHMIDGRMVEAKKAVPRDDRNMLNRSALSIHGSSGPGRTKKIFVGGLASTVTESDFKKYFDQFGTITDVAVMCDHNTQRPRGFGFITYDSEEAVDRVLHKTFHELNGKMVEVKTAVPKELSLGPSDSSMIGYNNFGLNRAINLFDSFAQRYNWSPVGRFGVRMDGRFSPLATGRSGISPFGGAGYGIGMNLDGGLSPSYGRSSNFSNSLGYGRMLSPYHSGNSNRFSTPFGFGGGSGRGESVLSSTTRNVWGIGGLNNGTNPASPVSFLGSGNGNFRVSFGNSSANWGPVSAPGGGSASGYSSGSMGYGSGDGNYGLGGGRLGRTNSAGVGPTSSFAGSTGGYEGSYGDLYHSGSVYGDSTWRSATPELGGSGSSSRRLGTISTSVAAKSSEGFIGSYNVTSRQSNRGIAT